MKRIDKTVFFAYDCTLARPGCAIIQVQMGGDSSMCCEFPPGLWLTSPTPDMKLYPISSNEFLDKLVRITKIKNNVEVDM